MCDIINVDQSSVISNPETQSKPLRSCTEDALKNYFQHLDGITPSNLYELVLAEVETPLLEAVLWQTRGNQTRAAHMLGLSRGTLRKKLKQYGLDWELMRLGQTEHEK